MTPQELLLAAAEDQEKYGNYKGSMFPTGAYSRDGKAEVSSACALGSLTRANNFKRDQLYLDAQDLLHAAINGRTTTDGGQSRPSDRYIPLWNDRPSTTAADVAAAMRKAAGVEEVIVWDADAVWDSLMAGALAEGMAVPYGV